MSLFLLASAVLLAQKPSELSSQAKGAAIAAIGTTLKQMAFVPGVDFTAWPQVVKRHREDLDAAKDTSQFMAALNEALAEFHVSHLSVAPNSVFQREKIRGFGFVSTVEKGKTTVLRVFDGTQAARAGLRPGIKLESFDFPDYPSTDKIEIGYYDRQRNYQTKTIEKESFLPIVKPDLVWGDSTTCVMVVPSFYAGYDKKLVEQLVRNAARFPNMLIDLRGNPGGDPDAAMHFLGAFLPDRTRVGAAVSKEGLQEFAKITGKTKVDPPALVRWIKPSMAMVSSKVPAQYKGRIAVLIDGGVGSAAEMVAQALRDHLGAPIFGVPSAGAVLFANAAPISSDYLLAFPWRDYWTVKGERLEGRPIQPDVPIALDSEEASLDPLPLRLKAIGWLKSHPK